VKDCDPETLEPDEEGYDDEYQVQLSKRKRRKEI